MTETYNPLDKINLGKSVADALLAQPVVPLAELAAFEGAGIYVLYYRGAYPAYAPIAAANAQEAHWPIYIGKAIPSGGQGREPGRQLAWTFPVQPADRPS